VIGSVYDDKRALMRFGAGAFASAPLEGTALFDWELAARATGERFDAAIAAQARRLLDDLEMNAAEIRHVSERGLRFLAEAFAIEDALCTRHGSSRPEEGSEHFLAYVIEYRTGRSFIHGELVALGLVMMAALQGNDPVSVSRTLHELGIPHDLRHLGLDAATLRSCLAALPGYCHAEALPYSVVDELAGRETADLVDDVCARYLSCGRSDDGASR
jgi:glycerol-1-phosphate dehydrogenase [NAD(P)+]